MLLEEKWTQFYHKIRYQTTVVPSLFEGRQHGEKSSIAE